MDKYLDVEIGKIYKIPSGTEFWSIALQETVIAKNDMFMKATNMTAFHPDFVFGTIQVRFENLFLQMLIGEAGVGYSDKANGDISVNFKSLIFVK